MVCLAFLSEIFKAKILTQLYTAGMHRFLIFTSTDGTDREKITGSVQLDAKILAQCQEKGNQPG